LDALLGVAGAVSDWLWVKKRGNPELDAVFVRQVEG
jgi:hypothetical protein